MLCWITLMLIYSLFNFYSLFKTHSYVLFFIFIYKNVVNIFMINDLYYPPTTHPHIIGMQFFLLLDPWIIRIARGYNRHPRITSTHTPYWFRHCCTRFTQTLFAVCMQSMWVTYAVQKQHGLILISHRTRLQSAPDPRLYHKHNIYPLFWIQIQTLLLKMLFQHCDLLLSKYSKSIFYRRV